MSTLARLRRRPATVGLVAWTFLVWTTRIANIWRDEALERGEQWGRTALALSFTVAAVAVAITLFRGAGRPARVAVDVLAAWTVGVWAVRAVSISLADHGVAFKLVHVVLAGVSVGLAYLAGREARRGGPVTPPEAASPPRAPASAPN